MWVYAYCKIDEYLSKMTILINNFGDDNIKKKYKSKAYKIICDN